VEEEGKYQFKAALPPNSSKKDVQEWNEWIERVQTNPSLRSVLMDGHKQVTKSSRKLDVPCHAISTPKSESNIVMIGILKKRRVDQDFTDEEKGQIFGLLQELLQAQSFREKREWGCVCGWIPLRFPKYPILSPDKSKEGQ